MEGSEPSEKMATESPKRNVVRKYGRARPAEEAQERVGEASTSAIVEQQPQESNTLSSDHEGGEDASYADLRKELGIGGWNDEVDAIDAMPEEQLRTLPANLLDDFDSDDDSESRQNAQNENVGRGCFLPFHRYLINNNRIKMRRTTACLWLSNVR